MTRLMRVTARFSALRMRSSSSRVSRLIEDLHEPQAGCSALGFTAGRALQTTHSVWRAALVARVAGACRDLPGSIIAL